jgi:hypothetical protein
MDIESRVPCQAVVGEERRREFGTGMNPDEQPTTTAYETRSAVNRQARAGMHSGAWIEYWRNATDRILSGEDATPAEYIPIEFVDLVLARERWTRESVRERRANDQEHLATLGATRTGQAFDGHGQVLADRHDRLGRQLGAWTRLPISLRAEERLSSITAPAENS